MTDGEIVRRNTPGSYFLSHGFDVDFVEGAPCEGPYGTRHEAEQLLLTLGCTDG